MSTRKTTTTSIHGSGEGFTFFDDHIGIPDLNETAITHIRVTYDAGSYIRSLAVYYNNKAGVTRGGTGDTVVDVILTDGEFITEVEGSGMIATLAFRTNKGKQWGPYGTVSSSSTFVWKDLGPHMGLLYFTGNTDIYLRALCGIFGTYPEPEQLPTVVKYENQVAIGTDSQTTVAVSKFTLNLIAPTVALLIGADSVQFHAPETLLCTLPFFAAALHGEFREASEKSITMPEDEPQHVSALIEFLYTGGYTYAYSTAQVVASDTPPADLTEGSFHVGVYSMAFKYDCQPLVEASLTSFLGVLRQLKGIDVIRLWKAAYDKELVLATVAADPRLEGFKKDLIGLLRGLYATHREEMDRTSVDYPALINDLLYLLVSE